jgi:hypothetical protein
MRRFRLILAAALVASACHRDAARPSTADSIPATVAELPEVPLSRFNVPLKYDFTAVLGAVDRAVPVQFGSLDSVRQVGDDAHRHFAFEAVRDPFTAFADGSLIHLRATLAYMGRGFFKPLVGPTLSAGCGTSVTDQPRIVVELITPLTLTANWHLQAHTQLLRLDPASDSARDRCEVRLLHYDVTPRIVEAARNAVTDHLTDIDRRIADVDLTDHFNEWWGALNRPIPLADGVWLLLGPERLHVGSVTGKARVLTVQVGLDARPRIVTGAGEPIVAATPLPPLAHGVPSTGYHILIEGIVDYATISRVLTQAIAGKPVVRQGHTLIFESVSASPAPGGRLAVAATFHGDASGTLQFIGIPVHNVMRGQVTVPDLDYDLRTTNRVVNAYAWLRSDALRVLFREQVAVPERPALDRGQQLLLSGLNRKIGDALTLSAAVDSVAARGLFVTSAGLVVRAEAFGHATAAVKQR